MKLAGLGGIIMYLGFEGKACTSLLSTLCGRNSRDKVNTDKCKTSVPVEAREKAPISILGLDRMHADA